MTLDKDGQGKIYEKLTAAFNGMMSALFRQKGAQLDINVLASDEAQSFINAHASTLDKSFETVGMSDGMRQRLQQSDWIFSGIKTFHELNEAFPSLLDEDGNRKPFDRFLNDVRKIDETYNRNYLRAEYGYVQASAEMAAKWEQYAEDGDRYNLQYRTAGDSKVRPEHAALNGITLPMSDPFWDSYYPPNGWNCFVQGTPVLTASGWKSIDTVKAGDSVLGGSGNLCEVTATMARTADCKFVTIFAKGVFATCTENHRFCTPHGWVSAGELKPGDIIIQLGEISMRGKAVQAISNMAAIGRKYLVALRAKREAVPALTIDYKAKRRYVEIGNVTSEKMKLVEWQTRCNEIVPDFTLGNGQWPFKGTNAFGMKGAGELARGNGTGYHIRTMEGRRILELMRNITKEFGVLLGLALTGMKALERETAINLCKILTCIDSSGVIACPLHPDSIAAIAYGNAARRKDPVHGTPVDAPVCGKPSETMPLSHIPKLAGIMDVHSFNGFNSFFDFLGKTFLHNRYIVVDGKVTENLRKPVYNLSVKKDESYIVPIGIAHNCRCTAVQVRKSKYPETPQADAMARGEAALAGDKKGIFRFNSGKQRKAVPDYNAYTIRRCRDCDVAQGKLNLAFVPDNELCAACKLVRQCYADKSKSESAILKKHYMHEMEPLLDIKHEKETNDKAIKVGFSTYGNKHLYSDTFNRSKVLTKDDLKDLGTLLEKSTYIGDASLTHDRDDNIKHFYYYKVKLHGKDIRLNVAKEVRTQKNGKVQIEYYLYSVNDIKEESTSGGS